MPYSYSNNLIFQVENIIHVDILVDINAWAMIDY